MKKYNTKSKRGESLIDAMLCIGFMAIVFMCVIGGIRSDKKRNESKKETPEISAPASPSISGGDRINPIGVEIVLDGKIYIITEKK